MSALVDFKREAAEKIMRLRGDPRALRTYAEELRREADAEEKPPKPRATTAKAPTSEPATTPPAAPAPSVRVVESSADVAGAVTAADAPTDPATDPE